MTFKLFLNRDEIITLIPLLNSLGSLLGKNQAFIDIVQKLEKVKQNKPEDFNMKIDLSHFSMKDELKEYLVLASQAIDQKRILIFNYINRNKDFSERMIEPIHVHLSHGDWYVAAYCRNRQDYRRFKLVRIRGLRLGEPFVPRNITPAALDQIFAESYTKRSIRIKLKFNAGIGEQLPEYFSKECIFRQDDGSFLVEDEYPYEEGLIRYIMSFGDACQVMEPDFFREEVKNYIRILLNSYNGAVAK